MGYYSDDVVPRPSLNVKTVMYRNNPILTCAPQHKPVDETGLLKGIAGAAQDRKSTRLNSSHRTISYAVFCLKQKTRNERRDTMTYRLYHYRKLTSRYRQCARVPRLGLIGHIPLQLVGNDPRRVFFYQ